MGKEFDLLSDLKIFREIAIVIFIVFIFYVQPYRLTVIDSAEIGIKFHKWSTNEHQKGGVEGTCKGWIIYKGLLRMYLDILHIFRGKLMIPL